MKLVLLLTLLLPLAPAFAASTTIQGTYRSGSFLRSVPAQLYLSTSGSSLSASIQAPGADCVLTFGTGSFAGARPAGDLYHLPVIESCGGPRGFGAHRSLLIQRNGAGEITNVKITGSNGKMSWTYFSQK